MNKAGTYSKFQYQLELAGMLLVLLLTLSSLFINQRSDHDWGGDFGLYLQEADQIAAGRPITDHHYIYNPDYAVLGPQVYPAGFPFLLATISLTGPSSMKAYLLLMSVFFALYCFTAYFFFRKKTAMLVAIILTTVMIFNFWLLQLKTQVLADIPFALFFMLTVLTYHHPKKHMMPAIVFAFIAIMIKSAGWILLVAPLAELPLLAIREKRLNMAFIKDYYPNILIPAVVATMVLSVQLLVMQMPSDSMFYFGQFEFSSLWLTINKNAEYLMGVTQQFLNPPSHAFSSLTFLIKTGFLVLITIGIIRRIPWRIRLFDVATLAYLLLLFIYPYQASGIRFLVPVLPMLIYYAVEGTRAIHLSPRKKQLIFGAGVLALLVMYVNPIIRMEKKEDIVREGPYTEAAQNIFSHIQENTGSNAVIAFAKPRVLGYLTHRRSLAPNPESNAGAVDALFTDHHVGYILTYDKLPQAALERYIEDRDVRLVYAKEGFSLFRTMEINQDSDFN